MARSGGTTISRNLKDIEADIKACDKAFSSASKSAKSLQTSLKLDPQNTKLMAAYYGEIQNKINACTQKIKLMREEQNKIEQNGGSTQSQEYQKLEIEIEKTTVAISAMNKEIDHSKDKIKKVGSEGKQSLNQVQTAAKGVGSMFKSMLKTATALVGAVSAIAIAFAETADEIAKASEKYKISYKEWQEGQYVWEKISGSADTYASVLSAMNSINAQAAMESSKLLAVLEKLGLTFEDVQNMNPADALEVYLEALRNCESEAERVALATKLFGSNLGPYIAEMAGTSSEAIAEMGKELEDAGIIEDQQVEKGKQLADTFTLFKKSIQAMIADSGEQLTELMQTLLDLAKALIPIITGVAKAINAIGPAGTVAIGIFISMMSALPALIIMLNALNIAGKQWVSAIASLAVLATVAAVGGAALVAANSNGGEQYKGPAEVEMTFADQGELEGISGDINSGNITNNDTKVVNYEDNSTINVTIESEADVDAVIEKISNAKRGMIGG